MRLSDEMLQSTGFEVPTSRVYEWAARVRALEAEVERMKAAWYVMEEDDAPVLWGPFADRGEADRYVVDLDIAGFTIIQPTAVREAREKGDEGHD